MNRLKVTVPGTIADFGRPACGLFVILGFASLCWGGNPSEPQQPHWAFQRMADPLTPAVKNTSWPRTAIDRFILAKLEDHGLQPSTSADKRTLIRRATFDLVGLPPTPSEVADFIADKSPEAFAKVVDRLLASPRYGERWGRHWLDVARYADSNGMDENLAYSNAWRYRDYVVAAFNADKPYDRFIREQLAGDLLPMSDAANNFEPIIATGFLAIGPKMLAEDDPMKMEMDIIDEQLDTTSRAFMGLTVGCARCHDHKFDPVPTADYYALAGIFKSTHTMDNFKVVARWQERLLGSSAQIEKLTAHRKRISDQQQRINSLVAGANAVLLREARARASEYLLAATEQRSSKPTNKEPTFVGTSAATNTTLVPEFLKQWMAYLEKMEKDTNSALNVWHRFSAAQRTESAGSMSVSDSPIASALFRDSAPRSLKELAERYAEHFAQADIAWQQLKSSTNNARAEKLSNSVQEAFRQVLYAPKGPFELPKNAENYYTTNQIAELKTARNQLQSLESELPALPEAMAVSDGIVQDLRVHKRGSHLALGEISPRGFLSSIGASRPTSLGTNQSGRLALANWIASPENPLTARVMVNRIWNWHFGEGLVRSPDNFGMLGEKPTHPELLDWLALRFIESGWSIKAMHRLIMSSAVFQQSSVTASRKRDALLDKPATNTIRRAAFHEDAATLDPENRLLSHFARRRLEAEAIRDSILFASGSLDFKMGGTLLTVSNRNYVTSTASRLDSALFNQPRRSVYLPVIRSALYNVFQILDFADPSTLSGHRDQTTVAPQALFMLNSKLVADATRRMAAELLNESELDDSARMEKIYRIAFNRLPSKSERAAALKYLDRYATQAEQRGAKPTESRQRAWQSLARTVVAANEFIYIE